MLCDVPGMEQCLKSQGDGQQMGCRCSISRQSQRNPGFQPCASNPSAAVIFEMSSDPSYCFYFMCSKDAFC